MVRFPASNIESDIQDYLPYKVPEVWFFKKEKLSIYLLEGTDYQLQSHSRCFPQIDLPSTIDRAWQIAYDRNTSAAIRDLRQRLSYS